MVGKNFPDRELIPGLVGESKKLYPLDHLGQQMQIVKCNFFNSEWSVIVWTRKEVESYKIIKFFGCWAFTHELEFQYAGVEYWPWECLLRIQLNRPSGCRNKFFSLVIPEIFFMLRKTSLNGSRNGALWVKTTNAYRYSFWDSKGNLSSLFLSTQREVDWYKFLVFAVLNMFDCVMFLLVKWNFPER